METPLSHLIAATKKAAKRCKYAAAFLEVRTPDGYYIDINVVRLPDRRVVFRDHIPYTTLHRSPQTVIAFVAWSIYSEYARLKDECAPVDPFQDRYQTAQLTLARR